MAEPKVVTRSAVTLDPGDWPGGAGGSLRVNTTEGPTAGTASLLRTISFPSLYVAVGAPGAGTPPEAWWVRAKFEWFMWVSETTGSTVPAFGVNTDVVYTGRLQPRLVASPSTPTEYYVTFEGPDKGFESRAQRKGPATEPFYLNTGLRWSDPLGGLDTSTWADVSVTTSTLDVTVWGIGA